MRGYIYTYIPTMATTTTTTTAPAVEHIILLPTPAISPLILPCSVQCCPGDIHPDADADVAELVLTCVALRLGSAACGGTSTWSGYEADESRAVSLGSGPCSGSEDGEGEGEGEDDEGGKVERQVPFSILGDAVYASPDEYHSDDDDDDDTPVAPPQPPSTIPPAPTPPSETTALLLAATAIPACTASPRPSPGSSRGRPIKKKYKTNKARRMFHRVVRSPNFSGAGRPVSRMRYGPVPVAGNGGGGGYESFPSPEFEADGRGGICRWFC